MQLSKLYDWKSFPEANKVEEFVAGMECEIESVSGITQPIAYWDNTNDGSLRNNGVEFISHPLMRGNLIEGFKNLHASIKYHNKNEAFSPRTSIHVHVNCRSLSIDQLKSLLLFYALYEEFFFAMVKPERKHNIHCVPLSQTYLSSRYSQRVDHLVNKWHKYTAFNMLPIKTLGTVEFRHMHGTADVELVSQWLKTLENLWLLAKTDTITPETIVETSSIERWFDTIFADAPQVLTLKPALHSIITDSLLDVKFALV